MLMEKAIVTFKDPDTNKEININFTWDKESNDLDYTISFSKNYSLSDNLDFNGFLANMFLKMLESSTEEENKDE